ncbi:MAG: PD-(D/E)XK nuclease family protein [Clostridia bacterium]|nr:PD-(D/E)XK nuclease family protein [Clostridia bacterium]
MLQLLIGPSGSGKTYAILENMAQLVAQGHAPILWLVPEQHSFESERRLLTRLGVQKAAQIQVLSFTRLADKVFREVGGVAGERLDEGVRALLMSRALEQIAAVAQDTAQPLEGLHPYLAADSAYVEQLLLLWEEMRQCAVSTEELERTAAALAQTEDTLLAEKTEGLYRVFTAYEGLAKATGLDELDLLTHLAQQLSDSSLSRGAAVFVDGFKGFTVQELAVLGRLLPTAAQVTVALDSETAGAAFPGTDRATCRREYTLFSPVTDTVEQLRRLADSHGLQWEAVLLKENHRTQSGALRALEEELYAPSPAVYEEEASEVTIVPCEDVYEECAAVARRIRRLLREEGYRCRDITVVARDLSAYQGLLDAALEQEGIPCYMDTRTDLLCEPLVVYLRAALRLAVGGWRTEEVFRLLKTDLTALSPVDIGELENYVYMWRIEGTAWEREWTENPAGLGLEWKPAHRAQLKRLNEMRELVAAPLSALRKSLRGALTGRQFALAVYTYLTADKELPARIAAQTACLEELAQPLLAAHAARLWDEVIGILDRFVLALGDQRMAAARLEELFTMLCQMLDMGHIPQGLDAVTVGGADRIRYNNPRVVFILGANEGVFPAYPVGNGLLTEDERRLWERQGVTLSADLLRRCVEERYYVYTAVSAPRERLVVCYHTEGECAPSPLIDAIKRILPHCVVEEPCREDGWDVESYGDAFSRLARGYQAPSAATAGLRQVIEENPAYCRRLAAVERSAADTPFRLEQPTVAQGLFGTDMCLSASQTESFYNCGFSYFCRYGLRIQPRRVAQVDAAAFGTIVHYVMEILLPVYTAEKGLIDRLKAADAAQDTSVDATLLATLREDVHRTVLAYLEREMGGTAEKSGRFLYQVGLAERSACNMLWHTVMELRQSEFVPCDFELTISPEEEAEEGAVLSLRLPFAGGTVQVRGKVDRVDLFVREDGTAYVRVVDYKTGTKTFELCELTAGLSMQMLLYLFILCDNSRRYVQEGTLRPAGILYHPLSDLTVQRGDEAAQRLKSMCMSGLVLDDPSVVLAMEQEAQSVFIPAKIDKGGQVKGSAVTLKQFSLLRGVVEQLLTRMAERLLAGDIDALPLQRGDKTPCEYCDYQAVCGRDSDAPVRVLQKQTMTAVLAELEEVSGDEQACVDG